MKHHEQLPLIAVARGAGAWLYDRDGKRTEETATYIDIDALLERLGH